MAVTNEIATAMESLDQLPAALLDTIMTKLDVSSICSVASTCTVFKACAAHILSFIPSFHLLVRISIFNFAQFEKIQFKIQNWKKLTFLGFLSRKLRLQWNCWGLCCRRILGWRSWRWTVAGSMIRPSRFCCSLLCASSVCSIAPISAANCFRRSEADARIWGWFICSALLNVMIYDCERWKVKNFLWLLVLGM